LNVQNNVDVTGNVTITGDLTVGGQIFADLGAAFDPNAPLVLGSTLEVSGITTLDQDLIVSGDTLTSGLLVSADAVITGNTYTKGLNSYLSTGAASGTSGSYAPVLDVNLDGQGDFISLMLAVSQDGGGDGANRNSAIIHLRVKQQNTMADPLPDPPGTLSLSEAGLAEWSAVSGATLGYEYQFSTSSTPDNNAWLTTANLQASEDFTGYVGQTVYVFVRTKPATHYTSQSVYVNYPAPANATLDDLGNASWSAVSGAYTYEYDYSTSNTPSVWTQTASLSAYEDITGYSVGQVVYFFVRVQGSPNYATTTVTIPTPNIDALDYTSPSEDLAIPKGLLGIDFTPNADDFAVLTPILGQETEVTATDLADLTPIQALEVATTDVDEADIVV